MPYAKAPFRHDIFLSYSHGDVDGTGDSALKDWSEGFARELEREMKTNTKLAGLDIFFDQKDRPSQGVDPIAPLGPQLETEVGHSAILAILLGPHYLRSKWCDAERIWWINHQATLGMPTDERIAVARIWALDSTDKEPMLAADGQPQFVGFLFHDKSVPSKDCRPLEWPVPLKGSRDPFRAEVVRMAGWLGLKLERLNEHLVERERVSAETTRLEAAEGGQVIYVHGRATQRATWDRTCQTLTDSGFVTMPTEPESAATDTEGLERVRQQRVDTMSGCDALMLVATGDGPAADADLVVVGRQDRNSARARSKRLLPCALLNTAGADFATSKRTVAAKSLRVQWIDATADPWAPRVKTWLHDAAGDAR